MPETQTSHISARREENESLKARICKILHWDEMQYAEMQWEAGYEYLRYYIPADPAGADMLVHSAVFWSWWKNHWSQRDRYFLTRIEGMALDTRRLVYLEMHDAATLARAIYPTGVVLEMSYAEMIQRLFDEKKPAI